MWGSIWRWFHFMVKELTSIRIGRRACAPCLWLQPSRAWRSRTHVSAAARHHAIAAAVAAVGIRHPRSCSRHDIISKGRHSWTTRWCSSRSVTGAANVASPLTRVVIRHTCWGVGKSSQHSQFLRLPSKVKLWGSIFQNYYPQKSAQSLKNFSACPIQSSAPPCFPSQASLHLWRLYYIRGGLEVPGCHCLLYCDSIWWIFFPAKAFKGWLCEKVYDNWLLTPILKYKVERKILMTIMTM